MRWNPKDLPEERPSTFDETGKRLKIYPATVKGRYRTRRTISYFILILIFLVLPWTKFQGKQTILLDIIERKFILFGSTYWAHDGPLVFFPLILAALTIVLVTNIWGRFWCGWGCPQTVFIDFFYRRIEQWIEGNHIKRQKLDRSPWNLNKITKKTVKWILFIIISAHIAHSFTAYFVGAEKLVWITLAPPTEHWPLFIFVQSLTIVLLFDFAWFREQFCLIMCPYGRFQSVLMDKTSMAIVYDEPRGEPRRGSGAKELGDCINCYRCVQVCPTGIDIRKGLQMECIACTACIDVCNDVMSNLKRPPNLIKYATATGKEKKFKEILTKKNSIYFGLILVVLISFATILFNRKALNIEIIRAIESPYTVSGETVINHFKASITNQSQELMTITKLSTDNGNIIAPEIPLTVASGQHKKIHFFIKLPKKLFANSGKLSGTIKINFSTINQSVSDTKTVTYIGPK
ncbi:MAG: cytochrome c oxidase accessory protein CcoG [Bdellovibrionota bacterium]